jgi:hypothetical protein
MQARHGGAGFISLILVLLLVSPLCTAAGVSKFLRHRTCAFTHRMTPDITFRLNTPDTGLKCAEMCEEKGATNVVWYGTDANVNRGVCSVSDRLGCYWLLPVLPSSLRTLRTAHTPACGHLRAVG